MKILLAPSETKSSGGEEVFDLKKLSFPGVLPVRERVVGEYSDLLASGNVDLLSKMFGVKNQKDILKYVGMEILNGKGRKAIRRYTGVAFDYLDYDGSGERAKGYIDRNVVLFSNLFGPIMASDLIPEYKLKQGEVVGGLRPEKLYSEGSLEELGEYFKDEEVLDLRAGFYDKFYKPEKEYTTLKFVKDGKVVSHWAKAYRGIVLRELAKAGVDSIGEFRKMKIEGLEFVSEAKVKNKTELTYSVAV